MSMEIRLHCLKAALELRTAGTNLNDLLAIAERFYGFVTEGEADGAEKPALAARGRRAA